MLDLGPFSLCKSISKHIRKYWNILKNAISYVSTFQNFPISNLFDPFGHHRFGEIGFLIFRSLDKQQLICPSVLNTNGTYDGGILVNLEYCG